VAPPDTQTLPLDEGGGGAPARVDHLYLALTAGKPIGGARWAPGGIDRIDVGRGPARAARREGRALRVDVPDPWMSSAHVRFERERAHWIAFGPIVVGAIAFVRGFVGMLQR
jgi:hypothetical protein